MNLKMPFLNSHSLADMAKLADKEPIYEAAEAFRERCLEQQSSLLWPTEVGWAPENLSDLYNSFIEDPDEGPRGFLQKWKEQIAELPLAAHRVATDALTLYYLFPTGITDEKKLSAVREVAGWKIGREPEDLPLVEDAFDAGGIGSGGQYYRLNPWLQVGFYLKFAELLHRRGVDARDWNACKELAKEVDGILPQRAVAARHILMHLLFPAEFERIASNTHKRELLQAFSEYPDEYDDLDEGIAQVRSALEEETGREGFDFYRDKEIKRRWDPGDEYEDTSREGESGADHEEESDRNVWIEKTIVEGRPDREAGPHACGNALWSPQESEGGSDIYRFMRDVSPGDVVFHLTDNEGITGISRAADSYEEFGGVAGTEWGEGPSYRVPLEHYRELDPPLSRDVFFSDPYSERLVQLRDEGVKNLFYTSGPELRQGAYLTPAPPELVGLLNEAYRDVAGEALVEEVPSSDGKKQVRREDGEKLSLDWLQERTLWSRSRLKELVEDLEGSSPQVVLAGPPGTSKTWVAKHVARYLTHDQGDRHRTVQFHPSYGYEDFIEGLRPVSDQGSISFKEEKGVLLEMTEEMREYGREEETHVLVIDEMNRANLPRVFGELMYLFEYRGEEEEIQLQYTDSFSLPEGLKFIATMNTADRSIRSIDIALRRRFDVFECMPDSNVIRQYYGQAGHQNKVDGLIDGFKALNERLKEEIDRHHQIGHTFFMEPRMTRSQLDKIWRRKLSPLIEEYFFDQPDIAAQYTLEEFWLET